LPFVAAEAARLQIIAGYWTRSSGLPVPGHRGVICRRSSALSNVSPVTQDDSAITDFETDIVIDLLQNDWDPDGNALTVDGIVQPLYGTVFDNGDGTVTYRPGLNFTGSESFKYWASDSQGGFTEGYVSVDVWGS
jgi:hypothetical protein